MIHVGPSSIDPSSVLASVRSPQCGAHLLFCGTTRQVTDGKVTERLEYEAYQAMAESQIAELVEQARNRFVIENASIVHRLGVVEVGEISIAIAVAAPHRRAAFEAGEWLLEQTKSLVPIWKQECWTDGSQEWIHPDKGTSVRPAERFHG